jgi:hypothetical protein
MCVQINARPSKGKRPSSPPTPSKYLKINHETTEIEDYNNMMTLDQTNHESTSISFDYEETPPISSNKGVTEQCPYQNKIQKSVSFYERVAVRPVLHVADYTDKEWKNCWYTPFEKEKRKAKIHDAVQLIREGKFDGCGRGLERMSDKGKTKERRRTSVREVLVEQEVQIAQAKANQCKDTMVYDTMKFRMTLRPHSRAARHVAHAMGRIDEMVSYSKTISVPKPYRKKCGAFPSIHSNDFGAFLQLDFTRN